MPEFFITVSALGGITRIVIDRPEKRNALSRELIRQLQGAIDTASQEETVRLVVLAANGPVFSAGMDLAEMEDRASKPEARELWKDDTLAYRNLLASIVTFPKPVLAVVQGPALAGGLGLVMACDLVLASQAAVFGLPEPKRGLTAAVVAPLVCYRGGVSTAAYLLLSGENLTAKESQSRGLCHRVVPAEELEAAEQELCRSILTGAPAALAATKAHLLETVGKNLLSDLDAGMKISVQARETRGAREGLAAFLEEREPTWFPQPD